LREEDNHLLGFGYFLNRTLVALKVISVVRGLLVWVTQFVSEVVCRIVICRGVQLRDVGRNFLLCGEGCTTFLGGILLGLLVYRVSSVRWGGMHDNHTLDGFRTVLTRIYGCLGVHP